MSLNAQSQSYITKRTLGRFIQVVVFLFAAFGGFLSKAAPPVQTNPEYIVGFSSFLVLIILIGISALATKISDKKHWGRWMIGGGILFALVLISGLIYPFMLIKLTYPYPPPPDSPIEYHIAGFELTTTAKEFIKENPQNASPGNLELNLPSEDIWTPESLRSAKMILIVNYTVLVLSIAAAIFCFLEANMETYSKSTKGKKSPRKKVIPTKRQ